MLSLEDMPNEILLVIFKNLSARNLKNVARVSKRAYNVAREIMRKPSLEMLPRCVLINVFKFLPLDDLVQITKCRNFSLRCAALNASLWKKVVILEPFADPYGTDIQEWIKSETGQTALLAYFDIQDLDETLIRFNTWKKFPSV